MVSVLRLTSRAVALYLYLYDTAVFYHISIFTLLHPKHWVGRAYKPSYNEVLL